MTARSFGECKISSIYHHGYKKFIHLPLFI
jgi:hypothetical protein